MLVEEPMTPSEVDLASGSEVDLASGSEVDLASGSEVDLASGSEVDLASDRRENQKKWFRERYQQRKEAGLCPICGERPPYEGASKCLDCTTKHRPAKRRYYSRQKEARRQGLGHE
jgi:hypothetical protein